MPKKMGKYKKNLLRNIALSVPIALLFWFTLLTSANTLSASTLSPSQPNFGTIIPQLPSQQPQPQQQTQVPQQNQLVPSSPQQPPSPPQISWDELEEAQGFVANGKIDSTIYTTNGNWKATGDWNMTVSNGEVISFDITMSWFNGTSSHTHEFLNFESTEDVDINAEDRTISGVGTMDVGTNGRVSWEEVPAEIVIQGNIRGPNIITISVDDEDTNEHFAGQPVHGNVTSLSICSAGPAMQISPTC